MYKELFAQKLKKARIENELTQKDVSEKTNIPRSTIACYETGKSQPDIETLGTLIDLYLIEAQWILGTKN